VAAATAAVAKPNTSHMMSIWSFSSSISSSKRPCSSKVWCNRSQRRRRQRSSLLSAVKMAGACHGTRDANTPHVRENSFVYTAAACICLAGWQVCIVIMC
jgi:hypothetical protein